MKNYRRLAALAALLSTLAARAQSTQAAPPAGAPAAEKAATAKDGLPEAELKKFYSKTVNDHVKAMVKKDGAFIVRDDVLNKDWRLKMVKVHTDRIWDRGDGRFFACADLRETAGPKTKVDLDFYVHRDGDRWVMDKVVVHKVSGKPRYSYVEDGGKWYMESTATKQRTPVE